MEEGDDLVAEVSLDGDHPVLGGPADSAFDLEGLAECGEVIVRAFETLDEGDLLACALAAVYADYELLLVRGERLNLLLSGCLLLKELFICRIYQHCLQCG